MKRVEDLDQETFVREAGLIKEKLYRTALLYLGSQADALEAVDEAIYRGLRACRKLREPAYFGTWMMRILINCCNYELRRRKRVSPVETLPETTQEAFDALPLREAIGQLPGDLRAVIVLRFFTGFTLEETAESLGIPRGTVTTRQKRALDLLRLELGEEDAV